MPDAAIFADTKWEPKKVHDYLDWLEKQLPFPVYRVMKDDGLLEAIKGTGRFAYVPFFTSGGAWVEDNALLSTKSYQFKRK